MVQNFMDMRDKLLLQRPKVSCYLLDVIVSLISKKTFYINCIVFFVFVLLWIRYTNLNWLIPHQKYKLSAMSVDQIYI